MIRPRGRVPACRNAVGQSLRRHGMPAAQVDSERFTDLRAEYGVDPVALDSRVVYLPSSPRERRRVLMAAANASLDVVDTGERAERVDGSEWIPTITVSGMSCKLQRFLSHPDIVRHHAVIVPIG